MAGAPQEIAGLIKGLLGTTVPYIPIMFDRRYMCHIQFFLGGGFNMFLFTLLFGEMIHFDICNIFHMGWFNHQLVPNCVGIVS